MRPIFLIVGLSALIAQEAHAETITMICKNPRREYLVVFDSFAKSLVMKAEEEDTPYRVDKIRRVGRGYVVNGVTTPGGPSFHALIDNQKLIQFFVSNKLLQTDYCRLP
jgi:hypothetical protein